MVSYFFDNHVKPAIIDNDFKHIVEIGVDQGGNTTKLLKLAKDNRLKLTSIDPDTNFQVAEKYDNFNFIRKPSLEVLKKINKFDCIIIDGDHNWYTVINELRVINKKLKKGGIIFLHDTLWPYARRDMYYNPERIPKEHRKEFKKSGIKWNHVELDEKEPFNSYFYNALREGGEKNGVLTAIEDFIKENKNYEFENIKEECGLGILRKKRKKTIYSRLKSKNPKASIILPVYNGSKYLPEAIKSVMNQTYENWELIIVDDASTDDSRSICEYFSQIDKRIKFFKNKTNLGIPKTRNIAVKNSKGKYIGNLDQDDWLEKHAIESSVKCFSDNKKLGLLFSDVIIHDEINKIQYMATKQSFSRSELRMNCIGTHFSFYSRKAIKEAGYYNEKLIVCDDGEAWMKIAKFFKVKHLNKAVYHYRIHGDNESYKNRELLYCAYCKNIQNCQLPAIVPVIRKVRTDYRKTKFNSKYWVD